MSTEKAKKDKRFPTHIQYSVVLSYFVVEFAFIPILMLLGAFVDDISNIAVVTLGMVVPILALIVGFVAKYMWAKHSGTEEQQHRVRAQFWSTLGFIVAFVITLLVILIQLILLEQDALLPQTLPDPITMMISGLILIAGIAVAWNTRKRILRNFGL